MDRCWKCGGPMSKNSRVRVCRNCGRTVQRHKNSSISTYDSSSSSGGGGLGLLLGIGLLGLALASSRKNKSTDDVDLDDIDLDDIDLDDDEDDYSDYSYSLEEAAKSRKRRAWAKKHRKGIAACIFVLIISIFFLVVHLETKLLIPLSYDSNSLEGLQYTEVVQMLNDAGFTNIETKQISDLPISRENEENIVTEVKLMHTSTFNENDEYPSNLWITVVYHTVEKFAIPLSSKDAKKMNYEEVVAEFKNAGFTNIRVEAEYDIITGWINSDGEIKSITINGDSKFDSNDKYRPDVEIVIIYHALRSNKPN